MKTDDLIRALAADGRPRASLGAGLSLAMLAGFLAAGAIFVIFFGPRDGLAEAVFDPRVAMKFLLTLALAAVCGMMAVRLSRPGARAGSAAWSLLLPAAILLAGLAGELISLPPSRWAEALVGDSALACLAAIPLLSLPFLAGVLTALRRGAASRPGWAGAAAGAMAGAMGAALYATYCTEDSPLFVAAWYGLAVAIMTVAGALTGRRLLSW